MMHLSSQGCIRFFLRSRFTAEHRTTNAKLKQMEELREEKIMLCWIEHVICKQIIILLNNIQAIQCLRMTSLTVPSGRAFKKFHATKCVIPEKSVPFARTISSPGFKMPWAAAPPMREKEMQKLSVCSHSWEIIWYSRQSWAMQGNYRNISRMTISKYRQPRHKWKLQDRHRKHTGFIYNNMQVTRINFGPFFRIGRAGGRPQRMITSAIIYQNLSKLPDGECQIEC